MEQFFQNNVSGGLDRDSSVNKYDNSHAYDIENLRFLTDEGLTSGALENVHGNLHLFDLPADVYINRDGFSYYRYYNFQYTGHTWIRKDLIIHCTVLLRRTLSNTLIDSDYSKYTDVVFCLTEANIQNAIDNNKSIDLGLYLQADGSTLALETTKYYWESYTSYLYPTVVWIGDMGFNSDKLYDTDNICLPLTSFEGRYENDYTKKIYMSDGVTPTRQLNIVYNATSNDLTTLTADKTHLVPDLEIASPTFDSMLSGGGLKAGMIQYAYQLLNTSGASSIISPCSKIIHLSEVSEGVSDVAYHGSDIGTVVNKSVRMSVTLASTTSGIIRLLAIFYEAVGVDPQIRIVEEQNASIGTMYFVDSGQSIGTMLPEEFVAYPQNFALYTMAVKFNVLYGGNTVDDTFDVDYDARVYRFTNLSTKGAALKESTSRTTNNHLNNSVSGIWGLRIAYESSDPDHSKAYFLDSLGADKGADDWIYWNNIPENWDLAPYDWGTLTHQNDVFACKGSDRVYKYIQPQPIGSKVHGGVGYNVSLSVLQKDTITLADNLDLSPTTNLVPNVSSNNLNYGGNTKNKSLQSDEVYRFAVVLFDEKGRPSFPKWIGDIRMPSSAEEIWNNTGGGNVGYARPGIIGTTMVRSALGVTVILSRLPAGTSYVQLVMTPRTQADRSIKTQGVLSNALIGAGVEVGEDGVWTTGVTPQPLPCYNPDGGSSIWGGALYNNITGYSFFYSPDISFNGDINMTTSGKIRVAYSCGAHIKRNGVPPQDVEYTAYIRTPDGTTAQIRWDKILPYFKAGGGSTINSLHSDKETTISYSRYIAGNFNENDINSGIGVTTDAGNSIIPYYITKGYPHTDSRSQAKMPKSYLVKLASHSALGVWTCNSTVQSQPYYHIVNYIENVFNSQYGGNTYTARTLNSYTPCGSPVSVASGMATSVTTYGDVFLVMMDQLFAVEDLVNNADRRYCAFMFYPCESTFNTTLRNDFNYQRNNSVTNAWVTQELAGVYTTAEATPSTLTQPLDYYKYNTAYSLNGTVKSYVAKPTNYNPVLAHDTRIVASNVKVNGETEDSWTRFNAADYIEVDGKFGQVTKLVNFKGQLFCLQSTGICLVSTQERELLQTENAGNLVLGSGTLLQRYDYIRTNNGTNFPDSVVATDDGVYFYDDTNKEFIVMAGGDAVSISEIKGLSSFVANIKLTNIIGVWNTRFNEIIWTLTGTENGVAVTYTLAYNELTKAFSSFYSFKPDHYIKFDNTILSMEKDTDYGFYRHNASTYFCDWYLHKPDGGTNATGRTDVSKLTLIINPQQVAIDRYDVLEFFTKCVDKLTSLESEKTFTKVKISNDDQDTGWITLYPRKNCVKRNRKWRFNQFRRLYNSAGAMVKDGARINGSYIKVEMEFTNANKDYFLVHDFITRYVTRGTVA